MSILHMESKRIFFPIMYYKEKAMVNDYSAFCKYIDDVSVHSFANINNNHSFLFVVSYNKDGITLFPSAKKHFSQNNSLMPVIFIEKRGDEEIKISAVSYLSVAVNLFLLLFLIIALVKGSIQFIIGTILFEIISQFAFWIPLNKAMEEVHRIIKVANTGEKYDTLISKTPYDDFDMDETLRKYDQLAGIDRYNGMIK